MKKYKFKSKVGVCTCLSLAIIAFLVSICYTFKNDALKVSKLGYDTIINITNSQTKKVLSKEEVFESILDEKHDTIAFLANTFGINEDVFIKYLNNNKESLIESDNNDKYLLEQLFTLEKENKKLFNSKVEKCQDSKEYMLALIKYFIKFYPQVDFSIAAGIAQVESNFSSHAAIYSNNIFGGMSNGRIIKYKNIEYGVLKYIKLLNDGYYNRGLTTIESIGRVYNPTFVNGEKVAKPSWVLNTTNAASKYRNYEEVDINLLISLKNSD